jgi:hypothetical protein
MTDISEQFTTSGAPQRLTAPSFGKVIKDYI